MAEAPVTTTKAPTPTAPNVPGSISNPVNPTFGADPVYIDQLNKLNFQNENFLAGDKETLANFANNYNRTLLGLEGTENKGFQGLAYRNEREGLLNSGFAKSRRQELAGEYTNRRGALAERLGQNYQRVGRGIQEREGKAGLAAGEYSQQAKGRAEKKAVATPLEAPVGAAAGYPAATATVNAAFPGGIAEQRAWIKWQAAGGKGNAPGVLNPGGTAQPRAKGGPLTPGHAYLVGEAGPELVVPKTPGRVVPNKRLAAIQKAIRSQRRG